MTQRRWMSMDEVFEQLEEAETEHLLRLWERRGGGPKGKRTAPEGERRPQPRSAATRAAR